MLGRSREDSESQAESIALERSACQAAASKGAIGQGMLFAGKLQEENFREKPILCAEQGHTATMPV